MRDQRTGIGEMGGSIDAVRLGNAFAPSAVLVADLVADFGVACAIPPRFRLPPSRPSRHMNDIRGKPLSRIESRAPRGGEDAVSAATDPWRLTQSQRHAENDARDETLFALANGVIGVRGSIEESPSPTQGTFIADVWERSPIHYHERHHGFARATDTRVPVADATAILIHLDGAPVDPLHGHGLSFERSLAMREGKLSRKTRWRTPQDQTLEVHAERIVTLAHPGLVCLRWTLRSVDCRGALQIQSCVTGNRIAAAQGDDPRFGAGSGLAMRITATSANSRVASVAQRTHASGIGVVCAQRHRVRGAEFTDAHTDENSACQVFAATLEPGAEITVEKYIAYRWTEPHASDSDARMLDDATALLDDAMASGFDALASAQADAFAAFWANADLAIDGSDDARRD